MKIRRSNKMKNKRKIWLAVIAVFFILGSFYQVSALNNGLATTPPMGWNSWNIFAGNIDETKIKQIADTLVSSGMKDAGYIYLNLDDNWMATSRDGSGNLRGDTTRFPSGMKALGDYIHSKGLKFGIYGCRGSKTCMGVNQSGSYGNEQKDANTFASWGVDYLKYDNCNAVGTMQTDYQNMKNALASCGRPIVFSVCAWEFDSWMPATGNLWRISSDITDKWDNGTAYFHGIINCVDLDASLAGYASPGAWNDPDMLEIGNSGCTTEEYRTQMSMWSILAAPLIAGNDIRSMSQATKDILTNTEIIAVDQDSAGIQGTRISSSNSLEVWCKPLGSSNGTTKAVALLNRSGSSANITVTFSNIGLSGTVTVRDLWAKADRGSFSGSYTMSVPSHGTGMLKISSDTTPTAVPTAAPTIVPNQNPIWSGGPYTLTGASTSYVDLPDGLMSDMGDFSVAAWVKLNSLDSWARIFDFGNDTNVYMMLTVKSGSTGYPGFAITTTSNSGEQQINGTSALATGSWVHVAVTKSGSTGILYINTQEVARNTSMTLNPSDLGNTANNYIGKSQWSADPYLNGSIDKFYVYNRALSASEVSTLGSTAPGGTLGDVNGNGTIDIVDALLIAQYYVGLNPSGFNPSAADVNCSGSIDIVDALLIAQLYVGLISVFPC
jgi:alpha-galactosidase